MKPRREEQIQEKSSQIPDYIVEPLDLVMPDAFSGFMSQNGLFLPKQFELSLCHLKFPESSQTCTQATPAGAMLGT